MTTEVWKPVLGYEDTYEVSDHGRVRSLLRQSVLKDGRERTCKAVVLKEQWTGRRYASVSLSVNGASRTFAVHRMVAAAFCANQESLPEVNHIDGDRRNNKAENLEWVTRAQNNDHAIATGLKPSVKGEQHGCSYLTSDDVFEIRKLRAAGMSGVAVAARFGTTPQTVSSIHLRKTWGHV